MAKFSFKLHAVLRQRELVEQERQREFALVRGKLIQEQQELKRLDETVRLAVTDLRNNQLIGTLNLSFLAAHRRFMTAMQRQGLMQLEKVEAAKKSVEAARVHLLEAAKQTRIMEKLRDRQLAAWQEAASVKETAAIDEVANQMSTASMKQAWESPDPCLHAGSEHAS